MPDNELEKGVPLNKAIRMIQDELIKSQNERERLGIKPLFKTEKLIIETNCIFTQSCESGVKGDIKLLTLLDASANKSAKTENSAIQKITLEFKVLSNETSDSNTNIGIFPYDTD